MPFEDQDAKGQMIINPNTPGSDGEDRILPISEELVKKLCARWSPESAAAVPMLTYWQKDKFTPEAWPGLNGSILGVQQRAFDLYWCIREGVLTSGCCLGIGTAGVNGPACFGTDRYRDWNPVYESGQSPPHMTWEPDHHENPFVEGVFDMVMLNHVFEHMDNQEDVLHTLLRLIRIGGYVCMVMPDMHYVAKGCDISHTTEFTAEEFYVWLDRAAKNDVCLPFDIFEHNTFQNNFAFNTVLQRTG